jgi:hypothetical protein
MDVEAATRGRWADLTLAIAAGVGAREFNQPNQSGEHVAVYQRKLKKAVAPVHDPMTDGADAGRRFERRHWPRPLPEVDDAQLEPRRVGVDDEHIGVYEDRVPRRMPASSLPVARVSNAAIDIPADSSAPAFLEDDEDS